MVADHPRLSIVTPAYCCAECLPELYRRLTESLEKIDTDYEIIIVNDCSPDRDWEVIKDLAHADQRVKGINFSRNFGQHHAITAGVDFSSGDWIVVMDCDLQDQPEEIVKLYRMAVDKGYDIVFGRRAKRKDTFTKKFCSRAFSMFYNFLSNTRIDPTLDNFSIASRRVMENYRRLRESSRAHGLALLWCGFRAGYVDVDHAQRFAGKSAYNLRRSVNLAIEAITSQSNKPLRMSIKAGFLMSGFSFVFAIIIIAREFFWGIPVSGWASTIVSIYFIGGLLMANMGVVGLYLGKVFDETKGRPIYIVQETVNIAGSPIFAHHKA